FHLTATLRAFFDLDVGGSLCHIPRTTENHLICSINYEIIIDARKGSLYDLHHIGRKIPLEKGIIPEEALR
ncbi:MAG: hypothetical protein ABSF74_08135, partial [Dehalococcoidia bacterium]